MELDKVTFGDGLPGYESRGDKSKPALIVIQVRYPGCDPGCDHDPALGAGGLSDGASLSSAAHEGGSAWGCMSSASHEAEHLSSAAQEWWGINAQIKELACKIGESIGCRVLIPDL